MGRIFGLTAVLAYAGCSDELGLQALGSMELTTTATTADVVTADNWTVRATKFLVHFTEVGVAGSDGLAGASSSPQIVDFLTAEPKSLLSSTLRTARTWEDVHFQISPAAVNEELTFGTEADRDLMVNGGYSIYVEGTLVRGDVTKTFAWGFTTATLYTACSGGLVVPPDGTGAAEVALAFDALFTDAATGTTQADAIGLATPNADGKITLDELRAVTIPTPSADAGASTETVNVTALLEARAREIVRRYGPTGSATGSCTAEAVEAAPPEE